MRWHCNVKLKSYWRTKSIFLFTHQSSHTSTYWGEKSQLQRNWRNCEESWQIKNHWFSKFGIKVVKTVKIIDTHVHLGKRPFIKSLRLKVLVKHLNILTIKRLNRFEHNYALNQSNFFFAPTNRQTTFLHLALPP